MAKMIWLKDAPESKNVYAVFRKEFDLDCIAEDAHINLCADSEYALFINDHFVDCGQYDDFPDLKYYDTLKIAQYLNCGRNVMTVWVYHQGESSLQYSVGKPGLFYELICGEFTCVSDESTQSCCDIRFRQGEMYKTTVQYGYGFLFDSQKTLPCFKQSEAYDAPLLRPRPIDKCLLSEYHINKILTQGTIDRREDSSKAPAQLMQTDSLTYLPKDEIFFGDSIQRDNIYIIYDMLCERCGYLSFEIDACAGCVVDIGYGEHLDDMRVRTSIGERNFANRYICCEGNQKFFYPYRRIAGRYIQLHIIGRVRSIKRISLLQCEYPLKDITTFKTDDAFLSRLHSLSINTLKLCMHEHYEDCPWREQALYGSDSRNQMLFGYYAFGEYKFARASLDLLGRTLGKDGFISICAPTDSNLKIPSFSFLWLLAMEEYARYSKDLSLAETYKDKLIYIADTLAPKAPDFIAPSPRGDGIWNFYEWSEGCYDNDNGINEPKELDGLYQVFLYIGLASIKELLSFLAEKEKAAKLEELLKEMKNAINRVFWNHDQKAYCSYINAGVREGYSELMQVMSLYAGIASDKASHIADLITSENNLVPITLSYTVYKYDALLASDYKYARYVYDDIIAKWGKMIFGGATSFWETEQGADDFDGAGSLCHGWSAVPLYILERYGKLI